jgi:hypothetical protein
VSTPIAKRFAGGKTQGATLIATSGDNTIASPSAGKKLTLFWIFLSASQDNASEVLAIVKLGSRVVYQAYLGNPGAFAHWEPVAADDADDALIVNLSASSQSVAVNYTITESP